MFDLVIRNGKVVDGTGREAFAADVAVEGGRIAEVGRTLGRGREEIDAGGRLVTPGFVDVHTHYDGQATWDTALAPSFAHGVTTVVMGNCGVGFAPVRPGEKSQQELIALMEGVEDIPGTALTEGMDWRWESFPEYLDVLAERKFSMDIGTQVPHGPLRTYVMGERGVNHEAATTTEIGEMARLAAEAVRAGALSFSTSRILGHQSTTGSPVPGTHAAREEMLGIGRAVGMAGGIMELVPGGSVGQGGFAIGTNEAKLYEELEWMDTLSRETGMAITFLIVEFQENPDAWKEALRWIEDANRRGSRLRPQTAGRPGGVLTGFQSNHLFQRRRTYLKLAPLPLAERIRELRKPQVRAAILADEDEPPRSKALMDSLHILFKRGISQIFPLGNPVNYEPTADQSVAAQAMREGVDPEARIYDLMLEDDGKAMLLMPTLNYARGNHDALYTMLSHPDSIVGLADGGAHCGLICDASTPTYMLTHWVRDRSRGPRLTLEHAVRKQTSETAHLYGLRDRGVVAPGKRADVNVIDFDALHLPPPYVVRDLPAGGQRMMQDAKGYVATIVAGVVTRRDDQDTGARPGRLVRGAR